MKKISFIFTGILFLIASTIFLILFFKDRLLVKNEVQAAANISTSEQSIEEINDMIAYKEKSGIDGKYLTLAEKVLLEPPMPEILPMPVPDPYENANLVPYEGIVEHIFFHPLIAYPERAFNGDASSKGMDDYMATALECKRLLEQVYNNGYVLVDINKTYEKVVQADGTSKMERIYFPFPEGKKPLVISLDDVNYYKYMREDGCNYKLIVDDAGNLATYSEDMNNTPVISYDTEVMTIVEQFVKEHPDFSFEGARGIVGVTGFDGILGYRTQVDSPNRQEEIEKVKPVIEKLKSLGWTFASHSYGHYHMSKFTYDQLVQDTNQWKDEVESLIGPTRVFLYPYGDFIQHTDANMAKLDFLTDVGGFDIHCGVSVKPYYKTYPKYAFEDRKNIDGLTLRNRQDRVANMFDANTVIDLAARDRMSLQASN